MPMHDWTHALPTYFFNLQAPWLLALIDRLNAELLPDGLYSITQFDLPSTPLAVAPPFADWDEWGARLRSRRYRGEMPQHSAVVRQSKTHRLVAAIEIIRPENLGSAKAVRAMTSRLLEYFENGIHLLLVDPFPVSKHKPDGFHATIWNTLGRLVDPASATKPPEAVSYSVGETVEAFYQPLTFGASLKEMPLFLAPDQALNLPLESTYQQAWDRLPGIIQERVTG